MYKIVVVDDEPKVRRGLTKLIPQLDPEWVVAGEAKNGTEALELVKRELPDAVITDIRMPRMNGLELLSALKEYSMHVVILSGYGYFEYAQTAVKFGAFDFLLKPLKPDDIRDALHRMKLQSRKRLQDSAPRNDPTLGKLWKDWLLGVEDGREYRERLERTMPDAAGPLQLMAIEVARFDELITEDQWGDRQLVSFAVRNIVQEILASEASARPEECRFLFANGAQLYFLLPAGVGTHRLCLRMIEQVKRWVNISISIGLSGDTHAFGELPEALRQAQEALLGKWVYGDGTSHAFLGASSTNETVLDYPVEREVALLRAMQNGRQEEANEELRRFADEVRSKNPTFQAARSHCVQLLTAVVRTMHRTNVPPYVLQEIEPMDLLHRHFTLEQFLAYVDELVSAYVANVRWNKRNKHHRLMDKALVYIRERYNRDLSLEEAAEQAEMSPSYFSSIFKQETGSSFVEYVTGMRIDESKELMKDPSLRLYEIARMVGYQDQKYYSRLFKKTTGVTPAEYRQFFCRMEESPG
ncbi:response regulator [Paenibacillus antri]|uniref:Response regulator n=1 Tax=Paenibacillus antri TaxID=2582848 RepID=A0A5R9G167_9BACL|nr:response regulator [Paenibacillus antri]TLS49531.1 response regulator [Paenibacillus antri]